MMKFFRKHNRKLLAVFMAALLVVWLGGSALQAMFEPNRGNVVVATSRFGEIRVVDEQAAQASTSLLSRVGLPWSTLGAQDPASWRGEPLTVMDWVLLTREAREVGTIPTVSELKSSMQDQILINRIEQMAFSQDMNPDRIYAACAEYVGVRQMQLMASGSLVPSEAELRVAARNAYERVKVNAVALSAQTFKDPEAEFSPAEIEEMFQANRESQPIADTLTFGYYQKPQVRIEYVRIDQAQLEENLRVSDDELERKARDFWRENRDNPVFKIPATTQPADEPTTQPTTQPDSQYYTGFAEAREAARQAVREKMAGQTADNLAGWMLQQFAEVFYEAEVGDDGYPIAPPEVKEEGYIDSILQRIPASLAYPDAIRVETSDWFFQTDTRTLPDIGTSLVSLGGGQAFRLENLAFAVQGLAPYPADQPAEVREVHTAEYQFSPHALRDMDENLYMFRVIGVAPSRVPDTVDVVRDQVVEDLRLASGYEQAEAALEAIKAQVEQGEPLADAWEQQADLKAKVEDIPADGLFTNISFPRQELFSMLSPVRSDYTNIPRLGRVNIQFVNDCFALGNETGDAPKLMIIGQPDSARVMLVEWLDVEPMTVDQYGRDRRMIFQLLMRRRQMEFEAIWASSEQIAVRTGFEWKGAKKAKDDEEVGDESETPDTAKEDETSAAAPGGSDGATG